MDESESWTVDINVHRRILTFLNAARRPDDLMVPPPHEILIVDDRLMEADERLHHDEAHDAHDDQEPTTKTEALLDRALARRLLRARDEYSPLHGFRHVGQLREIPGFDRTLLDRLIVLFSPRFRGDWELLYDDAD